MNYSYEAPAGRRVLKLLLICIVYFVLSLIVSGVVNSAGVLIDFDNDCQNLLFLFLSALVSIAFSLIFMRVAKSQRKILTVLTPSFAGNNGRNVLFGIILGIAGYLVYLLVPLAAGGISLTFKAPKPAAFILAILAVFAMALSEELGNRVFLFQNLRMTFKAPAAAILIAGIVFTIGHGVGDILSLLYYLSGAIVFLLMVHCLESTWCAYAFHISWNLLAMFFGEWGEGGSFFVMTSNASEASSFFTPDFGMGGDLPGVIINVVLIIAVWVYASGRKKGRKEQ